MFGHSKVWECARPYQCPFHPPTHMRTVILTFLHLQNLLDSSLAIKQWITRHGALSSLGCTAVEGCDQCTSSSVAVSQNRRRKIYYSNIERFGSNIYSRWVELVVEEGDEREEVEGSCCCHTRGTRMAHRPSSRTTAFHTSSSSRTTPSSIPPRQTHQI